MEDTQAPNDTLEADPSLKSPAGPIVLPPRDMPRDAKGHWLPGYKPTSSIMSSEQGRSMRERQRVLGEQSARKALAEKAAENGLQRSPAAAVGLAAGTLFEAAMTVAPEGKVREAKEGFSYSLRLAGLAPADDKQQNIAVGVQVVLASDAADWLGRQMRARVIDVDT